MIRQSDLISDEYLDLQRAMHAAKLPYGNRGAEWTQTVLEVAKRYDVGSILDYGSGHGRLASALREHGYSVREYDPAIEGKDGLPYFADLVVSTDMLEHVEPDKLDAVLAHMRLLARKAVFVVISTREAQRVLPNGKNAHLIIRDKHWWRQRVERSGFRLRKSPRTMPKEMPSKCWIGTLKP